MISSMPSHFGFVKCTVFINRPQQVSPTHSLRSTGMDADPASAMTVPVSRPVVDQGRTAVVNLECTAVQPWRCQRGNRIAFFSLRCEGRGAERERGQREAGSLRRGRQIRVASFDYFAPN